MPRPRPSKGPSPQQNQQQSPFSSLSGQLRGFPFQGGLDMPRGFPFSGGMGRGFPNGVQVGGGAGGGGGGPRLHTEKPGVKVTQPPLGNQGGDVGSQAFGTYAPDINDTQFTNENFKKQGLKGVSKLSGGGMGGMMGMGMGGLGGSLGGSFGGGFGGMDPGFMSMIQMLMEQLGEGRRQPFIGR